MDKNIDSKRRAQATLEAIAQLGSFPAFTSYFLRRQTERLEAARERVLHDSGLDTPQKLWEARLLYLERREAARLLESDETAAQSTIGPNKDARDL